MTTKLKPDIKVRIKKDTPLLGKISAIFEGISFYTLKRRIDNDDPMMVNVDVLKTISEHLKIKKSDLIYVK